MFAFEKSGLAKTTSRSRETKASVAAAVKELVTVDSLVLP
jgi:hypothetical protein